jgi:uncharacterized protein YjbI with pentapeptide repeats
MIQASSATNSDKKSRYSHRFALLKVLNSLEAMSFNMLVFSLNPPNGILSSINAGQRQKALNLLGWAETPTGPGLTEVLEVIYSIDPEVRELYVKFRENFDFNAPNIFSNHNLAEDSSSAQSRLISELCQLQDYQVLEMIFILDLPAGTIPMNAPVVEIVNSLIYWTDNSGEIDLKSLGYLSNFLFFRPQKNQAIESQNVSVLSYRFSLLSHVNSLPSNIFEKLILSLSPPSGYSLSLNTPRAFRTISILSWALNSRQLDLDLEEYLNRIHPQFSEKINETAESYMKMLGQEEANLMRSSESQIRGSIFKLLSDLPDAIFESLIFVIDPLEGSISSREIPQSKRVYELLTWSNSPEGPGFLRIASIASSWIKFNHSFFEFSSDDFDQYAASRSPLEILSEGVKAWNKWREENPSISPKLNSLNLSNRDLSGADLIAVDLRDSDLSQTILKDAKLNGANMSGANFSGADLSEAKLRNSSLSNSDFSRVNFSNADLRDTDCQNAVFRDANFKGAQIIGANFEKSILTGICLENWQIGPKTKLENTKCDYIFRQHQLEADEFCLRLPVNSESDFVPGEFEQWAKVRINALETIDLTFADGIDWHAFFMTFQELQNKYADSDISIQSMERNKNSFVVRIEVSDWADKATIENQAKLLYVEHLKLIEAQYRQQLNAKDREIEIYKQQSTNLVEIAKLAASRPFTIETVAMANNDSSKYNFQGAQFAGGFAENVEGDQIGGTQYNYAAPEKQNLAEAAAEIQSLLQQLEQTNPTATLDEQKAFVNVAIPPTRRERLLGAFQAGGEAALEELPYGKVVKAIVEGWREPGERS